LALLGAPSATTLNNTGQYLPNGYSFNGMSLAGPVQGHVFGAATFTNTGTIDLQANPVAGDVLLTSGGHTAGANGGGVFVSNGGRLLIDTVLNGGGSASQSDVLVVDSATVGGGGATQIFVHNAGGTGALTTGNGILVVKSTGGITAPGTFGLGNAVVAGPFEYLLFHGGVTAGAESDWFLRNESGPVPGTPCASQSDTNSDASTHTQPDAWTHTNTNAAGAQSRAHAAAGSGAASALLPYGGAALFQDILAGAAGEPAPARYVP
jgi:autotransporter family porin